MPSFPGFLSKLAMFGAGMVVVRLVKCVAKGLATGGSDETAGKRPEWNGNDGGALRGVSFVVIANWLGFAEDAVCDVVSRNVDDGNAEMVLMAKSCDASASSGGV